MPKDLSLLLHSLGFMKIYLTEDEREPLFYKTPKIIRKKKWPFIQKFQALKHKKRVFPSEEDIRDDIWVMCVDGVNCMICERHHPEFSRDTEQHDHKYNGCGLTYNLGMNILGKAHMYERPF